MLQKVLAILIGSTLVAIGINYFVIPHHLVEGGIIGVGLIGKYAFDFQPGLTIIILSSPLYLIAFFYERSLFYNGVHGLLVSSFLIDLLRPLSFYSSIPIFISSLSGGLIIGIGISILLLNHISSGGMDLIALILSKKTSINVGIFLLFFDSLIILVGSIVIPDTTIFYSTLLVGTVGFTTLFFTNFLKPKEVESHS
ncbi:YitT family protein [Paucisalibacillus sp. EB02]|uniref:YitT family protein n=1 Tax=Paucisalibacillus sp. EB02 TaxID=1347087 RepID=UPI0004B27B73|nr:YitT family protein [Paucisalibacillus sp. EB02]